MTDEPILSTKDRPGTYDAIETAKPGEFLFTLQAGDVFAPATIHHYAGLVRAAGLAEENPEKASKLLHKAYSAEQVGWAFTSYQRGELPVEETRASYNERTSEGIDLYDLCARAAVRLHNSVGESFTVVETLAKHKLHPDAEVLIREGVEKLKEAAGIIEPRRQLRENVDG